MIHDESYHPVNQSDNEIIGAVSGGFSFPIERCHCDACDGHLDWGKDAVAFAQWSVFSIFHKWNRKALFCRDCRPSSLDDEMLDEYGRVENEAIVDGCIRDRGFWAHYVRDGEAVREWTRQDGKEAGFAGVRLLDIRRDGSFAVTVTDVGARQYTYSPDDDGPTVAVPARVLEQLVEHSALDDAHGRFDASNESPEAWGRDLIYRHR